MCMPNNNCIHQVIQSGAPNYFTQTELYSKLINRTLYSYIPIPKNAHTWTTELLATNLHFTKDLTHGKIFQFQKVIIVLRDPIERWIAGAAQCLSTYDPDVCREFVSNDHFMKLICDIGRIDGHTNLQIDALRSLSIKQCIFFKCDSTLEPTMHHFIKTISNQDLVVSCDNYHRVEDSNESKQLVYQALTERLQDRDYVERVTKYVFPDIKFLEYITENNLWYDAR
jgi:hypothetical protein